jgi:2-methylcitrate dehydratase PrpD
MSTTTEEIDATGVLAAYAHDVRASALPPEVLEQARTILADTVGILCSASTRTAVRTGLAALAPTGGACTVVGHGRVAPAEVAAFLNGIGGHDIELDDSHSPSRTHPAAVIVSAALAAAEHIRNASLGDLLDGIVAGYEVQARVSKAMGRNEQYDRGFHPSAVCGAIGAAAAAGRILGLSVDEMRSCIGLAASQSSGLLTYADDPYHMAKSFQTGVAARNGVTAALFARAGYKAAPNVLAGEHDVLRPFGGAGADPTKLTTGLGIHFEIGQTSLKRHASCNLTHAAVDALLLLMADSKTQPKINAQSIERIHIELPHKGAERVDGNLLWTHNIQYVVAIAAFKRHVALEHFTPEWTGNTDVQALAARVTVEGSVELDERFPEQKGARLTVTTADGDFVQQVDSPRGSPREPLTDAELEEKFRLLAGAIMSDEDAGDLWLRLRHGDLSDSVGAITAGLGRRTAS